MAKRGRPPIKIDLEQVRKCAEVGCTDEEIADITGISVDTFTRRKEKEDFCGVLKNARSNLRMSLRRSQVVAALSGNVTAQIWLGKQLLGQRDKHDTSIEISDEYLLERLRQMKAAADVEDGK